MRLSQDTVFESFVFVSLCVCVFWRLPTQLNPGCRAGCAKHLGTVHLSVLSFGQKPMCEIQPSFSTALLLLKDLHAANKATGYQQTVFSQHQLLEKPSLQRSCLCCYRLSGIALTQEDQSFVAARASATAELDLLKDAPGCLHPIPGTGPAISAGDSTGGRLYRYRMLQRTDVEGSLGPTNHHPQNNYRIHQQICLKELHGVALFYFEDLFGHRQVLNLQVISTTGLRASTSARHFLSLTRAEETQQCFLSERDGSPH